MKPLQASASVSYRQAGVDTHAGQDFVSKIKPLVARTARPGLIGGIGGFGGLFQPDLSAYTKPVLVSSTDGVGTKLALAVQNNMLAGVGRDLVAMCVNDILTLGATPLFFLDYISCGHLDPARMVGVVEGLVHGCQLAKTTLLGGETAEHPGIMKEDEFDLAGFVVGLVDEQKMIQPEKIQAGDKIIGLSSSGPHSNGYSLIRKILAGGHLDPDYIPKLLAPTHIYTDFIRALLPQCAISGMVHLTGGGFYENIPRVLPPTLGAAIHLGSWQVPPVFEALAQAGPVDQREMFSVFNMGLGYLIFLPANQVEMALQIIGLASQEYQTALQGLYPDLAGEHSYLLTPPVKAQVIGEIIAWAGARAECPLDDDTSRLRFIEN